MLFYKEILGTEKRGFKGCNALRKKDIMDN